MAMIDLPAGREIGGFPLMVKLRENGC